MAWIMGWTLAALLAGAAPAGELQLARDRQDRAALLRLGGELAAAADKSPKNAAAQYQAARAQSYLAEVALELRDRGQAKEAAETGIRLAQQAAALAPNNAEYHRLLGTLCGQVIPANVMAGMKWGRCAQEEVNKAIELDPRSAVAVLGRGIGNYYLPPLLGGSVEKAIGDFERAIQLNPKYADAYLWLGIALRKANRPAEARKAIQRSVELNPNRVWAKQQLDKTPQ
ncbi:MAG: tetratricopeptide repeat protein [Acidobacteria bacterium]|nr:tetratricopeptide repeat protein [Acidobacteriota bacterium]